MKNDGETVRTAFLTLTYDMALEADRVMRARAADPIMARGVIAPATGRIDLRTLNRTRHQKASCAGGVLYAKRAEPAF